jgi:hypothetical protein
MRASYVGPSLLGFADADEVVTTLMSLRYRKAPYRLVGEIGVANCRF